MQYTYKGYNIKCDSVDAVILELNLIFDDCIDAENFINNAEKVNQ